MPNLPCRSRGSYSLRVVTEAATHPSSDEKNSVEAVLYTGLLLRDFLRGSGAVRGIGVSIMGNQKALMLHLEQNTVSTAWLAPPCWNSRRARGFAQRCQLASCLALLPCSCNGEGSVIRETNGPRSSPIVPSFTCLRRRGIDGMCMRLEIGRSTTRLSRMLTLTVIKTRSSAHQCSSCRARACRSIAGYQALTRQVPQAPPVIARTSLRWQPSPTSTKQLFEVPKARGRVIRFTF